MYMQILFDIIEYSIFNWMEKIVVHNPKEIRYNTSKSLRRKPKWNMYLHYLYIITRKNIVLEYHVRANFGSIDHQFQRLITRQHIRFIIN